MTIAPVQRHLGPLGRGPLHVLRPQLRPVAHRLLQPAEAHAGVPELRLYLALRLALVLLLLPA